MAKVGEKEAQRRAMREKVLNSAVNAKGASARSGDGVALQVRPHPSPKPKAKFDKVAYQREYMRRLRAALKAAKATP